MQTTSPKLKSKKISEKEIANQKAEKILFGVAKWAGFYRCNPQRFVKDYLNITLKTFQKILIYAMMSNSHFMFLASRSLGKTWLTALFCVIRCILFPQTKICIASKTREQANEVLEKITDDFCKNFTWGSDNLNREISYKSVGQNKAIIKFHNGSWIQVVTAKDTGRGKRANVLIIDEFRMVDKNTIDTVLKRFLGTPRQPLYLEKPKYSKIKKKLLEPNRELYMSSAWLKSHWSWDKAKAYISNMLNPSVDYFVCALPYQIAVLEALLSKQQLEDEMSEADFDEFLFSMEMEVMWFGDTDGSFFTFEDIYKRRRVKEALYPPSSDILFKVPKVPDLLPNERRILSLDVALMGSTKKRNNDAASIMINRSLPTENNKFNANLVFMENHEGMTTDELALRTRKLYEWFGCTDLVIDTNGNGLGVYDALIRDIIDPETGDRYPALNCRNNKEMAERCKVHNAPKVIWSIKGSSQFNSECCILLRQGFQQGKINLLITEDDYDSIQSQINKPYKSMDETLKFEYQMPYRQTTLLVYELINLQYEINGNNTKVFEKSGMRKDRYSSLAYNYWVQYQLERELLQKDNEGFTVEDYVKAMKKLKINKKPTMY